MNAMMIIARREFREAVSDWRTLAPMLVMSVCLPGVILVVLQIGVPLALQSDPLAVVETIGPFTLLMVGFFPSSYSLLLALESFVGEKERRSLEPLLSLPLSTEELYFGKLLGSTLLPVVGSIAALCIYAIGLLVFVGYGVSAELFVQVCLLTSLEALVMVAAAVVVSTHATTIRAANLLASFVILPAVLMLEGEALLVIRGHEKLLWLIIPELLIISLLFIRLGIQVFDREEMLARGSESLDLRATFRGFARHFVREPDEGFFGARSRKFRPWHIYTSHLPQIIRDTGVATTVTTATFAVGLGVGFWIGAEFPIPSHITQQLLATDPMGASLGNVDADFIFRHNTRVVLTMGVGAIFSFGAIALIVSLLPGLLVGYLAASAWTDSAEALVRLVGLILPHGIIELPAVFLACGLALRIGLAIAHPPRGVSIGSSLTYALVNYGKGLCLILPLLYVAANVEAYLTPYIALLVTGR
ncbi:MAG: stage II sporulation protein M [Chloroflexi bacterium]|nr:stage II sporulation protein M [Chloroflexota bacterium]